MADRPKILTLDDIPLDGQRVLVRVDFNVAVGDDNNVGEFEDYRIKAALPTIEELSQRRAKIILITHRGNPKDNPSDADLSPIHHRLEQLLNEEVKMAPKITGDGIDAIVTGLEPGGIVMLPNIRSDDREEANNKSLAEDLSQTADAYVNEAFSVCHRAHASVVQLPAVLPSAAGRRTVIEVEKLSPLRAGAKKPYVAIASGSKISTKVELLRNLLEQVDKLCLGGRLANVFLAALGKHNTDEFSSEDITSATDIIALGGDKLVLPVDVIIGEEDGTKTSIVGVNEIPADIQSAWDLGPASIKNFLEVCQDASTIMWNGPVGRFEIDAYAGATNDLAQGLAKLPAYKVVGGGDTIVALSKQKVINKFDHVSIGGGAMIAFLEGQELPGLKPLYAPSHGQD